jgi:hypothetical protein
MIYKNVQGYSLRKNSWKKGGGKTVEQKLDSERTMVHNNFRTLEERNWNDKRSETDETYYRVIR